MKNKNKKVWYLVFALVLVVAGYFFWSSASPARALVAEDVFGVTYALPDPKDYHEMVLNEATFSYAPGARIEIDTDSIALGDVTGDGLGDVVVLVNDYPGGSATYHSLHVVSAHLPKDALLVWDGYSVRPSSFKIENGSLVVVFNDKTQTYHYVSVENAFKKTETQASLRSTEKASVSKLSVPHIPSESDLTVKDGRCIFKPLGFSVGCPLWDYRVTFSPGSVYFGHEKIREDVLLVVSWYEKSEKSIDQIKKEAVSSSIESTQSEEKVLINGLEAIKVTTVKTKYPEYPVVRYIVDAGTRLYSISGETNDFLEKTINNRTQEGIELGPQDFAYSFKLE